MLVVADDLGWGDARCYAPGSLVPTAALDRLAGEGLRLMGARTPSALCTPSRYAMLTGRAHWRTGSARPLVDPYGPPLLRPGTPTLPSILRGAGYRTALVGKWHLGLRYARRGGGWTQDEDEVDFGLPLGGGPTELGFDRFVGTAGCCTSDPPYALIDGERFVTLPVEVAPPELTALPGVWPGRMEPGWDVRTVDDRLVDAAEGILSEHAAAPDGPPLLLMVALSAPHNPWEPPPTLVGASGDGPRGDMAAAFDVSVGRLLRALDDLDLAGDTLLIVTSDHGPQYEAGPHGHRPTGPFRGRKNTVWEGGLRVPLWLRWPGRVAAGATSDVPYVHTDLLPTLAALAGAALPASAGAAPQRTGTSPSGGVARDVPASGSAGRIRRAGDPHPRGGTAAGPLEGYDLSSAWLGGAWRTRGPTLFECGGPGHRIGAWAVVDGAWKLVLELDAGGAEGAPRLYDLAADPGEARDLAPARPDVAARLVELLRGEVAAEGWPSLAGPPPADGPRTGAG